MSTVCQEWVTELPRMFQSILFTSLRGPDQELLVNIKLPKVEALLSLLRSPLKRED